MKKLSIQLNQNYKSFENKFKVSLDGDLIILSGVNGSGKSQLIDIIRQQWISGQNKNIEAIIKIDGTEINKKDILFRSFKEAINITEIQRVGVQSIKGHKDQIWNAYNNYQLDPNRKELEQFQESSIKARKILIDKFGEEKFKNNQITQEDIDKIDMGDFAWRSDDVFTNIIGDLFFDYAKKVHIGKTKCGDTINKFSISSLETPPWIQLNNLFFELGLEYRFKGKQKDYFIKVDDFQLNESPKLYQLKKDGDIDENDSRNLSDLSDGEKAIILLIFASFSNVNYKYKKILLLDEFDATFNPSLVEAFYKLIYKYFISKDILVVIATHSPATISLAPEYASFYEAFSKTKSKQRILSVQKDDYNELRIANKNFYTRISDQKLRIEKLKKALNKTEKLYDEILKTKKPIIFSEGYNFKYLKKAKEFFDSEREYEIFEQKELGDSEIEKLFNFLLKTQNSLPKKLFILDCDSLKKFEKLDKLKTQFLIAFIFSNNKKNSLITKGIENLFDEHLFKDRIGNLEKRFFPEKIIDRGDSNIKKFPTKVKNGKLPDDSKDEFQKFICEERKRKKDFENFKPLFEKIKTILKEK